MKLAIHADKKYKYYTNNKKKKIFSKKPKVTVKTDI